jgi:hypothetical protein
MKTAHNEDERRRKWQRFHLIIEEIQDELS